MPLTFPITIVNGEDEVVIGLNKREYGLYTLLKTNYPNVVLNEEIKRNLEMSTTLLRVTKKSLQEKLESYALIENLYNTGYTIRYLSDQTYK